MPSALVTGAGRGIGRACAVRLANAGWQVYAGVRREQDGAAVVAEAPQRIISVQLDVTDAADRAALAEKLPPRLDAVVNNAGIVVGGALEALPIDELRRQFEVNVIGQLAITQSVLGRLRESRGRIVFVSSISGLLASPMLGAYAASKFAVEAIADALRVELRPWHIAVSLIEPGQIDTDLWGTAPEALDETIEAMTPHHQQLYATHIAGMRRAIPRAQKMAAPVDDVAKAVERALSSKRPKARYVAGTGARAASVLARFGPTPMRDLVLGAASGVPRKID